MVDYLLPFMMTRLSSRHEHALLCILDDSIAPRSSSLARATGGERFYLQRCNYYTHPLSLLNLNQRYHWQLENDKTETNLFCCCSTRIYKSLSAAEWCNLP